MSLKGKTLLITGASRGIGLAIGLRAARDGANVAILAKTTEPHPKLPGTIYTAAKDIEAAGGKALPIVCDIRYEEQVKRAVDECVAKFGGIDILVNNASAISPTDTLETSLKKYDLMNTINTRGTWLVSKYCIPHLKKSQNGHILNISPPLSKDAKWYGGHVAYTISKMGMSMVATGLSEELRKSNIGVNTLWPLTLIYTAALQAISDNVNQQELCRNPEIMADAAHCILTKPSTLFTGNFCIDEIVLRENGQTKFEQYAQIPGTQDFGYDGFIDDIYFQRLDAIKAKL
ncbi:short-chain dehydrogenase/reductase SDR [Conidiobolus coronatus NRRL 28638]|uniref:Hydroxysteroid dehydrogenase-like protein 2 n=1 Tax=Conidiobolus coronatus (strain ATCC 28846 / CBS 209.66 / NRRL 28638) TaxID=796925 RepID=A0A137NTN9_CONC2|nr:short-chain dehydrogenase/reductase SDR [Conidiobolus coronatus NRRL 28638]|eukprot:KXN66120.1 short-chain dehydrogenase/reductase SDR [Conidiobolus coronatus NRRL 28638]